LEIDYDYFFLKGQKMRKVKANLRELMEVFEDCRIGDEFYLDVKTGELLRVSDEFMDTSETEEIYERLDSEPEKGI